jgi:hypothetical protein
MPGVECKHRNIIARFTHYKDHERVRKSKLYTLRNRLLEIEPLIWIDKCKQNKSSNGRALLIFPL